MNFITKISNNLNKHADRFEKSKTIPTTKIAIFAIIFVIIFWIIFTIIGIFGGQNTGTFGDTFGSLNALFSGFAFVGVIYAILLQREELRL